MTCVGNKISTSHIKFTLINENITDSKILDISLSVWLDRVRHLATDPVVRRSNPATGHILRFIVNGALRHT